VNYSTYKLIFCIMLKS